MLVDDAIVEIENIVRHMKMGKSGYQAALDAADRDRARGRGHLVTIIAVFLPVSFMGGIIGQFFIQFGLTVAAAVFFSLLVARLITPVIAAYTLKRNASLRTPTGRSWTGTCGHCTGPSSIAGRQSGAGGVFFAAVHRGLALMPQVIRTGCATLEPRPVHRAADGSAARRHGGGLGSGLPYRRPPARSRQRR